MSDLLKRIGTFKITRELIEKNPEAVVEILKDVLVVHVESNFPTNALIYIGYSKHFDLGDYGVMPPKYIPEIYTDKSWEVTWHREKEYSEKDVRSMLNQILGELKINQERSR
jgi:hypothetical protein